MTVIVWLRTHWTAALPALAVGVAIGWIAHRPAAPTVKEQAREASTSSAATATDTHVQQGTIDAKIVIGAQPCPPAPSPSPRLRPAVQTIPEVLADLPAGTVVELHQGPATTDVHEREQQTASEQKSVDLTIAPSTRTGWEAQAGVEDLLGSPQLRLEVRRHLFGPFWIGAAGVPMRGQVGLSASVEW